MNCICEHFHWQGGAFRRVHYSSRGSSSLKDVFRPTVLDVIPRPMQKMAMNAGLLGVSQVSVAVFVEAGLGSRADSEQTLLRIQHPVDLNKKSILDNVFDWRFNLDRLLRMKMNVLDPSLQITTLLTIVERLTSRDPLFRHRLHTVVTENNFHGLVRQRQIVEFWSYLVAEVRELEVATGRDVRAAAMIQTTEKQGSSAVDVECEYFKKDVGCRHRSLYPHKHVKLLARKGKCYNCGALGHRTNECPQPKRQQRGIDKGKSQNPGVAQVLEVPDDGERESVSRIVAATVREILGDPDPSVSVRTLAISDGVLGVIIAAQQACDNGTWILADTGATHEPVSVRKGQKIPTGTRPCKLQLAIGHVDGWASDEGLVYIESETDMPSIFSNLQNYC